MEEIVEYASQQGIVMQPAAIRLLKEFKEYKEIIDELANQSCFIVGLKELEERILKRESRVRMPEKACMEETIMLEEKPKYKVLWEYDVTNNTKSQGSAKEFLEHFRDKHKSLERVLKQREGFSPRALNSLRKVSKNSSVQIAGMVSEKWVTKKGHIAMRIEDLSDQCLAVALKDDKKLIEQMDKVGLDDVIGVEAKKASDDMLIVSEVFFPDIPQRRLNRAERDCYACMTSDCHVGSDLFLEHEFQRFIEFLKGESDKQEDRKLAKKIDYLFVAGDLVAGVGIYPDQYDDLLIKDLNKQCEKFEEYILELPERIQVFIGPGNHDPVRIADPQPAIDYEYFPRLKDKKNVTLVGSPTYIEVEGAKVLMYHGTAIDELVKSSRTLTYSNPEKAMEELLRRRCLDGAYGLKNNIVVPEKKDYLVMAEVPDVFLTGHTHHNGYANYKGVLSINSGAWEKETAYQRQQGHVATPGRVPLLNLKSFNLTEKRFLEEEAGKNE